ncbi:Uncharacterised protein g2688 [Pycnogonum litorale]
MAAFACLWKEVGIRTIVSEFCYRKLISDICLYHPLGMEEKYRKILCIFLILLFVVVICDKVNLCFLFISFMLPLIIVLYISFRSEQFKNVKVILRQISRILQHVIGDIFHLMPNGPYLSNYNVAALDKTISLDQYLYDEIKLIIKLISKDFVRPWYEILSDNEEFVNSLNNTVESSILKLCCRLSKVNRFKFAEKVIRSYRLFLRYQKSTSKNISTDDTNSSDADVFNWNIDNRKLTSLFLQAICCSDELRGCDIIIDSCFVDIISTNVCNPLINLVTKSDWLYEAIILLLSDQCLPPANAVSGENEHRKFSEAKSDDVAVNPCTSGSSELDSAVSAVKQLKDCSASEPALCDIEMLYNKKFFGKLKIANNTSEVAESSNFVRSVSLPDLNELRLSVDFDLDPDVLAYSHDTAEDAAVLFSISATDDFDGIIANESDEDSDYGDIKLVFTDVSIPTTEQHFSHSSTTANQPYTIYCIQYMAWYMAPLSTETSDDDGGYFVIDGMKLIRQQSVVRRRYREFVNLQTRLEANLLYKQRLKDIRTPNKYINSPFSNMAKHTVEQRRKFLQQYLQTLCQTEDVCTSAELREFMAYGINANIAFVRKPIEISIPRIDKIVINKVSGMFSKIRTVLPTLDSSKRNPSLAILRRNASVNDQLPSIRNILPKVESLGFNVIYSYGRKDQVNSEFNHGICKFIRSYDVKCNQQINSASDVCFADQDCESHEENDSDVNLKLYSSSRSLSNEVIDLATESFRDEHFSATSVHLVKFLFGDVFNRYLEHNIEDLTSQQSITEYLRSLRDELWPGGILNIKPHPIKSTEELLKTKQDATDVLKESFPAFVLMMIGEDRYDDCVKYLIDSIQDDNRNKFLLYLLIDNLFEDVIDA